MTTARDARVEIAFGEHPITPALGVGVRRVTLLDSSFHDFSNHPLSSETRGIVDARALERALVPTVRAVERDLNAVPRTHRLRIAPPSLSHREWSVLRLLAGRFGTAVIAAELGIEVSTVKSHITSVCLKLGVASRAAANDLLAQMADVRWGPDGMEPLRARFGPSPSPVRTRSLRVTIASDKNASGGTVAGILRRRFERVAELGSLEGAGLEPPDVLVIDARRGAIKSATLGHRRRARPDGLVAIVADDPSSIRQAFGAGIDGVVCAGDVESSLSVTVEAVAAGQLVAPAGAFDPQMPKSPISIREDQVLRLANRGMTNDEIAEELDLASSTVKSHLSSGYRKLNVSSRSEAGALLGYERRG